VRQGGFAQQISCVRGWMMAASPDPERGEDKHVDVIGHGARECLVNAFGDGRLFQDASILILIVAPGMPLKCHRDDVHAGHLPADLLSKPSSPGLQWSTQRDVPCVDHCASL
jgi:hypothetical protein